MDLINFPEGPSEVAGVRPRNPLGSCEATWAPNTRLGALPGPPWEPQGSNPTKNLIFFGNR